MSTLGRVCLVLTLLLMVIAVAPIPAPYGGWVPRLLVVHNQWAEKLRDAKKKAQDAVLAERNATMERDKALTDLESQILGWDRYWNVPARGQDTDANAPSIAKQNGRLILNNIGSNQGLEQLTYTDDAGNQQLVNPIVFAFFGGAEGFNYVGEFRALNITASRAELEPVHGLSQQEFAQLDVNAAWRLRTMVPPGERTSVDELYRHGRQTVEMIQTVDANLARQDALLKAAQAALATREAELLGDPSRDPVPNRPELHEGLLKVTEQTEEERNQLLVDVDRLRRAIKVAHAEREAMRNQLNQLIAKLPTPSASQFASARTKAGR
ncbi:MAG: hypothetical protein R3C49_07105 [Planctomycetaceae bacterium]